MIRTIRVAAIGLCTVLVLTASQSAAGSPGKTPKGTVLCLPPGSSSPKPCASVAADSPMAFRAGSDFQGTAILRFRPRGVQMESKPIDMPLATGSLRRGQLYRFTPPRALCAGRTSARSEQRLQFEIQILTADLQQSEANHNSIGSDHASVGVFQQQTGNSWTGTLECNRRR